LPKSWYSGNPLITQHYVESILSNTALRIMVSCQKIPETTVVLCVQHIHTLLYTYIL